MCRQMRGQLRTEYETERLPLAAAALGSIDVIMMHLHGTISDLIFGGLVVGVSPDE